MFKKILFHSITAGILAGVAGIIYNRIYFFATEIDFSKILNPVSITSICIAISVIAGLIYWGLVSWLRNKGEVVFNFLFSIVSFAMVMYPISVSLPLEIKNPELFPGLAVPMVFFPALAWYTVKPLFKTNALYKA
ncbi:MAG: hypothetical protein ABJA90_07340 [Ginsengibacter sp.]